MRSRAKTTAGRFTAVWLAIGVLVVIFAAGADAHKVKFETTLQFKVEAVSDTLNRYEGKVVSDRAKCERNRNVFVDAFDTRIAEAVSLFNGTWGVTGSAAHPPKGTTLIAFTPRKFLKRSSRHKHKCLSDFAEKKAP